MFGQNNKPQDDQLIPDQAIEGALQADQQAGDNPAPADPGAWQHPGTPLDASTDTPAPAEPSSVSTDPAAQPTPQADNDMPNYGTPAPSDDQPSIAPTAPVSDDLLEIKQHALSELSPLVDQLEQTPEEKFRTTMMMIQASDDQSLIHVAYEAALNIADEKTKAQALLDVINEINYFTQKAQSTEQ